MYKKCAAWCDEADKDVCKALIRLIMDDGNFGRKKGIEKNVEAVSTSIRNKGVFKWLQYAGKANWKLYHRYSFLEPFAWIYQVFRYTRQMIVVSGRIMYFLTDYKTGKKREKVMKRAGVVII